MAQSKQMKVMRVGKHAFKVHPDDLDAFKRRHPNAEEAGGYETKTKPKPAAKKAAPKADGKE